MASSKRTCSRRFIASTAHLLKYSRHSYSTIPHYPPEINRWSNPSSTADIADDDVSRLAASPIRQLSLADLVRHGRPPLSNEALLNSANFTLSLIPNRLAHRIQSLRNLPYIVVSNPHISKIYTNYLHSLSTLLPYQQRQITSLEEERKFTEVMADLVQTHSNTIPILATGFLECRKYISPAEVTRFLDEHLRARIGTRLIAEQHLALHMSSLADDGHPPNCNPNYIGVIDTALHPAQIVRNCETFVGEICELKYGVRPTVTINGEPDASFAHVPVHLEYIVTELLKNSFRAAVESGKEREPIEVTIAAAPDVPQTRLKDMRDGKGNELGAVRLESEDIFAGSPPDPAGVIGPINDCKQAITIRIRDRGGGISPEHLPNIWAYSFTTFGDDEVPKTDNGNMDALNTISGAGLNGSSIAGLGYGLPLGRAYAEYFGGGIAVQSLWGWGTDVYLTLQGVGKIL